MVMLHLFFLQSTFTNHCSTVKHNIFSGIKLTYRLFIQKEVMI